jgi:eukaryotic-like serine/threonine-protein kinase
MGSPLSPGTRLGRYEIRSLLGAGGRGEVYLALDTELDRTVALKILPPELASDLQRMRRFVQEAKAASGLNHQNIITIYEIGEIDSTRYIATEFVDGVTLRQRMKQAPLTLSDVLEVAIEITSALSAAHEAGIVHRDVKPDNIMLRRRDGFVKVLDFGLVKLTEPLSVSANANAEAPTRALINTNAGTVMGTVGYMSPEQARGKDVDARTDIFSVGAVVYEMLAGCAPFTGETTADVLGALLHKEPAPLTEVAPDTPTELQHVVGKALRKDREERYQTAKDLLVDLRQLKKQTEAGVELERTKHTPEGTDGKQEHTTQIVTARPTSTAEYAAAVIKKHKSAAVAVLVILLLLIGGFGVWYFNDRTSRAAQIESLAVLPFQNASGNADVEYLSDGMTESLINNLSQLPRLSVKARSSVFRYKGKDIEPQRVASELSVEAILNGRVVQRGDDLTLYLSLVDGRTGNQLWGEQYDRKLTDLVSLQSEIARDVSQKLRARLSVPEEQKVAKNYTPNSEAYQLYLKGRYHTSKLTVPELQTAISYFQKAIDLDPNYPLAYVGLANAYRALTLSGEMPATELLPKAKLMAQKAVELDDTLSEAHAVLGVVIYFYDWKWKEAEREFKRAVELDPNSADSHQFYAQLLSNQGRQAEAIAEIRRAREIDPLNLLINAREAQFLTRAGQSDQALASVQKTFELDPNYWFAHLWASDAYVEKGMFAEAVAEARKSREASRVGTQATAFLGYALAKSGNRAESRAELAELLKSSTHAYVSPYNIALIYNGLGDRNEALAWLKRGVEQRDPRMVVLNVEPKFKDLRGDARFQDLLSRIGF